jgi:hypothetical protein
LRALEREVVSARQSTALPGLSIGAMEERRNTLEHVEEPPDTAVRGEAATQDVVLDYCAAVRGILNDDHGGPLHPPGLRMAEALGEVQASLQRNLEAKKGGLLTTDSRGWPDTSTGG